MVHYGVSALWPEASHANICERVSNTPAHGQRELALLCQHTAKPGGTTSTDVSVFDRLEVREENKKLREMFIQMNQHNC